MVARNDLEGAHIPRKPVKNGFQRRQFQRGARPLRGDEAMQNLCPCHVRKRIDAAWDALYCGLQDSDLKVRQAAWHTLEENHGGRRDDPKLYPIMVEIAETEVDPKLRQSANSIIKKVQTVEEKKQDLLGQRHHYFTGKCDWCGDSTAKVCQLYDSKLEIEGTVRLAQVCDDCQSEYEL